MCGDKHRVSIRALSAHSLRSRFILRVPLRSIPPAAPHSSTFLCEVGNNTRNGVYLTRLRLTQAHAIACRTIRHPASACVSRRADAANARGCGWWRLSARRQRRFACILSSKCNWLRVVRHNSPQRRAFPFAGTLQMHAIACSAVRLHAATCVSVAGGLQNARSCG